MAEQPGFALTPQELDLVADQAASAVDYHQLGDALGAMAVTCGSDAMRLVSMAFVYLLREADHGRGGRTREPYELMFETGEGTFPPRPAEVLNPVRDLWRQVADAVDHPIVQSRLLDLAYVADGPKAHAEGRSAAVALEALAASPSWSELDRAVCMARALDIARELNDRVALAARAAKATHLARALLEGEHPGPPFIVLRTLTELAPDQQPQQLAGVVDAAVVRFDRTEHHVAALGLQVAITRDQAQRHELRRAQVDALEAQADGHDGLVEATLLRRAAEFAQQHGLGDRAETLLRRLQSTPVQGLERLQVREAVDAELIEFEIDVTAGAGSDDLGHALRLIGAYGPPGGTQAEVDETVAQQRKDHPLAELFNPILLAPGTSIPIFVAEDEEGRRAMATGRHRAFAANYYAVLLLDPMLHRALAHHGRPPEAELAQLWSTEVIGPQRGERIARALSLFWDGHPDDAAHVLVPRLESVLRDVARASGMLVRKAPGPGAFGGVKTLGPVMRFLRDVTDDDEWICHLEALLCDPLGLNLRNSIAHGLQPRVGPAQAALLLQAACYLLRLLPAAGHADPAAS